MAELIKVDEKVFANLKRSRSYRHTKIQNMLESLKDSLVLMKKLPSTRGRKANTNPPGLHSRY